MFVKFPRNNLQGSAFVWMIGWLFIFSSGVLGASVEEKKEDKKTEVVETKNDLDQMTLEDNGLTASSNNQNQEITFNEQKLIQLSKSLKNAIEENKELMKDKEKVLEELKQLRGQHEVDSNRLNALIQDRDESKRRAEEALKTSQERTQKIEELQASLDQKAQESEAKMKKLEEQLTLQEKLNEEMESMRSPGQKGEDTLASIVPRDQGGVKKMFLKVRRLNQENDQLKKESAKVHYNLGNTFFKQGEYDRAVEEYRRAVKLMPDDPANHYNLAFVSGEFLNDQKTALKHYQQYLFLNPGAQDAAFVKEKILKARMELKSAINSPLDERTKINDDF